MSNFSLAIELNMLLIFFGFEIVISQTLNIMSWYFGTSFASQFVKQAHQFLFVGMSLQQISCQLIFQCLLVHICTFLQQKFDYSIVHIFLAVIHLDLHRTKVVKQGETPIFINYPIYIGTMVDQELRDSKTNTSILEAYGFVCQSVDDCSQGRLVQCIGFIYLGIGQHQQTNDFIISSHACDNERSLLIVVSLQVHVYLFVAQQKSADLFESYVMVAGTEVSTVNKGSDQVIDVAQIFKFLGDVEIIVVDINFAKKFRVVTLQFLDEFEFLDLLQQITLYQSPDVDFSSVFQPLIFFNCISNYYYNFIDFFQSTLIGFHPCFSPQILIYNLEVEPEYWTQFGQGGHKQAHSKIMKIKQDSLFSSLLYQKSVKSSQLISHPLNTHVSLDFLLMSFNSLPLGCKGTEVPSRLFFQLKSLLILLQFDVMASRGAISSFTFNLISNGGCLQKPFTYKVFFLGLNRCYSRWSCQSRLISFYYL